MMVMALGVRNVEITKDAITRRFNKLR
jgi:hypothetical protein